MKVEDIDLRVVLSDIESNSNIKRIGKEFQIARNKLTQLISDEIEIKRVFMKGKKFVSSFQLVFVKENKEQTLELSREDFYNLKGL